MIKYSLFGMWDFFFNYQNFVTNLNTFSHSNDFLAAVMLIFCIYSTRCSSIRTKNTIFPIPLLKNTHHNYYKHEIAILFLKPMGCNYFEHALHFAFNTFTISCQKNMVPYCIKSKIWLLYFTLGFFSILRGIFFLKYLKVLFLVH